MKKLIALIAVLSYVPFAHAADGDWTHSGEYRLQYTQSEDADFSSSTGDTDQNMHQRAKLNTTVRAGEKMTFNLGLVHNADWGSNADQTPDDIESEATNNVLVVNEAFASWQSSDDMTFKAGRISQTLGDGSVVSANDWEPVAKAFDAAGMLYDMEQARIAAFAVTGAKASNDNNNFGNFYGIAADWKTLPAWLKMAHFHYIMVKRDEGQYEVAGTTVGLDKEDATRIGLTLAGDMSGFDYKGTYAMYSGETVAGTTKTDIDASMMDFEFGYSMPAMMNARFHAGYHTDSGDKDPAAGDNEAYTGFHYETHNNAGLMDVVGWGNLTYTRFGFSLAPMEDITVMAEYLMFEKTEKGDNVTAPGSVTDLVANGDDEEIGSELDLTVSKKYSNNFNISASYRMFEAGKGIKQTKGDDDTMSQWYLESKLTF